MDPVLLSEGIILAVLLAASAFFSGSETALFSMGPLRRRNLRQRRPRAAERVDRLLADPHRILSTILIGNTAVNVACSSLGYEMARRIGLPRPEAAAIAGVTLLLLTFGEVVPKILAIRKAALISSINAPLLEGTARLLAPLRITLEKITGAVLSRTAPEIPGGALTEEEYRTTIRIGRRRGVLLPGEERMIAGILDLDAANAADVMTPRVDVVYLDLEDDPSGYGKRLREGRHRLVPVCRGGVDEVLGVLRVRDYLLEPSRGIEACMRKPMFVPSAASLSKVLRQMQNAREQLAIVIDEYGGVEGLITIEDIVEKIFGEIHDEFEKPEMPIRKIGPERFRVSGRLHLDDLEDRLGIRLEEEGVDTVGGFVTARLGRVPKGGDVVEDEKARIVVRRVDGNRVETVDLVRRRRHRSRGGEDRR